MSVIFSLTDTILQCNVFQPEYTTATSVIKDQVSCL